MHEIEPQKVLVQPIGTVDLFPSASLNDDPLLYPGVRPETSFLLDGEDVFAVDAVNTDGRLDFSISSPDGSRMSLNEYLAEHGVASMEDRIPILGYGANMCPASIKSKFTKIGRPDGGIVPTVYADLHGYDVVWSGGPGINGNFIANLYTGPETQDTTATVGINFLTQEQLLVMHATELSYDLTTVEVVVDGVTIKALVYAGVDDILIREGKPVAVDTIKAEGRTLEGSNTQTLLDEMLSDEAIVAVLTEDEIIPKGTGTSGYIAQARELASVQGAKLARKKAVHGVLSKLGKSRSYQLPKSDAAMQSWANPSTIPTYGEQLEGTVHKDVYVLPSQVLDKDKWDPAKRELVLRSMGTHLMRITGLIEQK